jgi:hypothetical protein
MVGRYFADSAVKKLITIAIKSIRDGNHCMAFETAPRRMYETSFQLAKQIIK